MTECEQRCEENVDPDKNRCDATGVEARAGADARQQVWVGQMLGRERMVGSFTLPFPLSHPTPTHRRDG